MKDITEGFYLSGQSARPLVNGQATAAVTSSGRMTIGEWGRDVRMMRYARRRSAEP